MPRAFIQYKDGIPAMESLYKAQAGFEYLGFDIVPFEGLAAPEDAFRADIVCGYVSTVKGHLRKLGHVLEEINYPEELENFMGRTSYERDYAVFKEDTRSWPQFIKPVGHKRWEGRVVHGYQHLPVQAQDGERVLCSEVLNMVSEYRCFIRYRQLISMRLYRGNAFHLPDYDTIQDMANAYHNGPHAYSLDVAVVLDRFGDKKTVLVEVNDGYSLGTYGIDSVEYARFLYARWSEITGVPDATVFVQ